MNLICGNTHHVHNTGNNHQQIFFTRENYVYFLRKVRALLFPYCDILSYCLLPDQFNFLIYVNEMTVSKNNYGKNIFSEGLRTLLSSYARSINFQENRTGSLFRQNTRNVNLLELNQTLSCFNYIHQLPLVRGLVERMEDWHFSSYRDYCGLRKGTLWNKNLADELLNFQKEFNRFESYEVISREVLKASLGNDKMKI